jgi:hypothetical protein
MMKKFSVLTILFVLGTIQILKAQHDISTTLVYNDTIDYPFTSEWQYLSSDIYLFNAGKFDKVINQMEFVQKGRKRSWKKNSKEKLEYLFVSAKLKNVKFMNNSDLVYPLYNFQINTDADRNYHTYVSDKIDHIRILDNLPIYKAGNTIDAEIKVQAISNNDSDKILNLIGSQLQGLSVIPTPTEALFKLVGEFGKFLVSNTKKKEYRFSSTIRLYETQNFDTRLHSIKIFVLHTKTNEVFQFDDALLSDYLGASDNPQLGREKLANLIHYSEYPLLVVANYRSMYKMKEISGDEITQDAIDERRARILVDFKNGHISDETYKQERDFLRFLTAFVEMKNAIQLYSLNQGAGNVEATKKSLPKVISRYNNLTSVKHEMEKKYEGNSFFNSVFRTEYDEILGFASMYMDADPNLKSAKELVAKLNELQELELSTMDSLSMERTLNTLHFAQSMGDGFLGKTKEGIRVQEFVNPIENQLHQRYFLPVVHQLNDCKNDFCGEQIGRILEKSRQTTQCLHCKKETEKVLSSYKATIEKAQLKKEVTRKDSLVSSWSDALFVYKRDKKQLSAGLRKIGELKEQPVGYDDMLYALQRYDKHLENIQEKSRVQFGEVELDILRRYNEEFIREGDLLQAQHAYFERNKPCLLDGSCEELKVLTPKPTPIVYIATDSLKQALHNRMDFFRHFDLELYASKADSVDSVKRTMIDLNIQLMDSLTQRIAVIPDSLSQKNYALTEDQLNGLLKRFSDGLNDFCIQYPKDCLHEE